MFLRIQTLILGMLDENMRGTLDQLIDRTIISFHSVISPMRTDKQTLNIQNESDYALGLAHGMILTGFMSYFKDRHKREPNQEEIVGVSKVLFDRTNELRESHT